MLNPVLISLSIWLLLLIVATTICYRGGGDYYHRKRLGSIPVVWMCIWVIGASSTAVALSAGYALLFCAQLGGLFFGGFFGWIFVEAFGMSAVERIHRVG